MTLIDRLTTGLLLLAATLMLGLSGVARADELVIKNVKLIDVVSGDILPDRSVRVVDGRIVDINFRAQSADDTVVIDGREQYLIPGLTDSHVHVDLVPGFGLKRTPRNEDEQALVERYRMQLPKSYLFHGVTQLVDLAGSPRNRHAYDEQPVRPDLFQCGAVPVMSGYPTMFMAKERIDEFLPYLVALDGGHSTGGIDDVVDAPSAIIERVAKEGAICVKLFMEDGFGPASDWPMMSSTLMDEIIGLARRADLKVVVHANALDMQQRALQHDVDVLAHGLWNWGDYNREAKIPEVIKEHLNQIAELGIGIQPTFGVMRGIADLFDTQLLVSKEMRNVVPSALLAWYASEAGAWFRDELIREEGFEGMPFEVVHEILSKVEARGAQAVGYLDRIGHDLLLGSDTPSSPTYANQPGLGSLQELKAMAEAGVSLIDVLRSATINNAQAFGLARDHGTVEPGKVANLLLLEENPLESVSSYETISTVILHGDVIDRAGLRAEQ